MPTIAEHYEHLIRGLISASERECGECRGTMQRAVFTPEVEVCDMCQGKERGPPLALCPGCEGRLQMKVVTRTVEPCDCNGGTRSAARTDSGVCMNVLLSTTGGLIAAREAGDFGTLNLILDWAHAYCLEVTAAGLQMYENLDPEEQAAQKEMLTEFIDHVTTDPAPVRKTRLVGGTLTEAELRDLGVLDE